MPTITMTLSKEEMEQLISGALVECMVLPSMKPGSKFYLQVESKYEMPPRNFEEIAKEQIFHKLEKPGIVDDSRYVELKERPWGIPEMHYVYAVGSFHQFKPLKEMLDRVSDKLQRNLHKKNDYLYVIGNVEIQFCNEFYATYFENQGLYLDAFHYNVKNCIWMRNGVTLENYIMDILKGENYDWNYCF